MKVFYHKKFLKSFSKFSRKQQLDIIETIEIFRENPFNPQLKNHAYMENSRDIAQSRLAAIFDYSLLSRGITTELNSWRLSLTANCIDSFLLIQYTNLRSNNASLCHPPYSNSSTTRPISSSV